MMISKATKGLFDILVPDIDSFGLPILSEVLYSPGLHFDPELRKYIVANDIEFKDVSGQDNWIGLIWNREVLKTSQDVPRRHHAFTQIVAAGSAKRYNIRVVELQLSLAFVGTSLTSLELLEEYLLAKENRISFNVSIDIEGNPTDIKISVREFDTVSLTKEDTTNYGSLATLGCNCVLTFPVIQFSEDVKIIKEINFNIYDYHEVLLTSRQILP